MNTTVSDYLNRLITADLDLNYSKTLEEHKERVSLVLDKLREACFHASIRVCAIHV